MRRIFFACLLLLSCFHLIISDGTLKEYLFKSAKLISTSNGAPSVSPTISPSSSLDFCFDHLHSICGNSTNQLQLNETLQCIYRNGPAIENVCASSLEEIVLTTLSACQWDLPTLCWNEITHPFYAVLCLYDNYDSVSQSCRMQLNHLLSPFLPCTSEASQFCSDKKTLEEIRNCLLTVTPRSKLSNKCSKALAGYENCTNSDSGGSTPCWDNNSGNGSDTPDEDDGHDNTGDQDQDPSATDADAAAHSSHAVASEFLFICSCSKIISLFSFLLLIP
jgi:hypothetical protein